MPHTWSLACDFHFFMVSVFVLILLRYRRKMGLIVLFTMAVSSVAANFAVVYFQRRTALLLQYPHVFNDSEFYVTYNKSHLRAAPYFIGLYGGYFYYRNYATQKRMKLVIKQHHLYF